MVQSKILPKLIEYQSLEYRQACKLRYRLFYQEHNLPWDLVINSSDANCFHLAIAIQKNIIACGQFANESDRRYQIK